MVQRQRLLDECQSLVELFRAAHLQAALLLGLLLEPQYSGFQRPGLVVAAVEYQAAVQLVESIIIALLAYTDAGRLEIAGICPGLVPR